MKASEYFRKYLEEDQDEDKFYRVVKAFHEMFHEVAEIRGVRNAKSDTALISIFNEQNTKANSFIRKVNEIDGLGINRDGFKLLIVTEMPDLAKMINWK